MSSENPVIVDRGRFQDAVTPWDDVGWRTAAVDWATAALAARGLRPTGEWRVRSRPWSVLARLPVEGREAVWFKANPPASAFEGPLTAALARWAPGQVLEPIAVDAGRGWSLLPDGGPLLRDALDRGAAGLEAWESLLRRYAALQHALTPRAPEIERLGVPRTPVGELPGVFDRFDDTPLRPEERQRLRRVHPRLLEWCDELAALGVPDSLDHADLHDGQVLHPAPGTFTVLDWGDAVVSHPFCSLAVPARRARERYGPGVRARLRDAYLEPWTGDGRSRRELRRAVDLAWRLSALSRAGAYARVFPASGAAGAAVTAEGARCLLELFDEPPP